MGLSNPKGLGVLGEKVGDGQVGNQPYNTISIQIRVNPRIAVN
jgi:hypothetical protein